MVAKYVEKIESTPETILPTPSNSIHLRAIPSVEYLNHSPSSAAAYAAASSTNTNTEYPIEDASSTNSADNEVAEATTTLSTSSAPEESAETQNTIPIDTPESDSLNSSIVDIKSNDSTFVEEDENDHENAAGSAAKDNFLSNNSDSEWEQVSLLLVLISIVMLTNLG